MEAVVALVIVGLLVLIVRIVRRPERRSSVLPAFLSLLCALLLTGGAGLAALDATCNFGGTPKPSPKPYLILTIVGLVAFIGSAIWLFVAAIVRASKSGNDDRKE